MSADTARKEKSLNHKGHEGARRFSGPHFFCMRPLIITTTLLAVLMFCSCSRPGLEQPSIALPQASKTNSPALPEPLRTLNSELTVVKNTSQLPSWCKAAFIALTRQPRFEMAEPGEKFQVADVIVEHGLHSRRLVFGGLAPDRCLVRYERGGRGHSYYAVLFGMSPDGNAAFLWGGAGLQTESTLEQLRSDIASGRVKALGDAEASW